MRLLDEQYLSTPFYGARKLTQWLQQQGYNVNKKRVKRLMNLMGWQTLYRKPNTSWKDKAHLVYHYLLKVLKIAYRNQAWGIDITYIPMRRGFMYLCAIIDLHTRYVVNWNISNTMTAQWCRSVVEDAIDNIFIERLWKSVKYECVYLHAFEDGVQLYEGLRKYFYFYNHERIHQSLDYKTPASFYRQTA